MESLTEEIITPASLNYHKPAEFQEHECCWMSWPCEDDAIPGSLEAQHRTYADVANAIVNYEPVNMLVDPGTIDMARAHCDPRINLMCGSYINFYFANKSVIIPGLDDDKFDKKTRMVFKRTFPDRDVVQVPSLFLYARGGNIHCITQQQPKV